MNNWGSIFRQITILSQMGLSLIAPLLLCLFLCSFLTTRFGLGGWIYLPGFFFGLGGLAATARKIYIGITKHDKKNRKSSGTSFNHHS